MPDVTSARNQQPLADITGTCSEGLAPLHHHHHCYVDLLSFSSPPPLDRLSPCRRPWKPLGTSWSSSAWWSLGPRWSTTSGRFPPCQAASSSPTGSLRICGTPVLKTVLVSPSARTLILCWHCLVRPPPPTHAHTLLLAELGWFRVSAEGYMRANAEGKCKKRRNYWQFLIILKHLHKEN